MNRPPAIWGHRGASAHRPENTLAAFAAARELRADGVELDVRRTADGALAVHHDAALPDGRLIVRLTGAELPETIPSLADVLAVTGEMTVNIEIKNVPVDPDFDPKEAVAAQVADLVGSLDRRDRVIVSSFSLAALDAVRAADTAIRTGWLTLANYDQLRALETAVEHGHNALHPFHSAVTADLIAAAGDAGVAVHTWTVDDPGDMVRLAALGVDAIITNVVDLAVTTYWGESG